MKSIILVRHAKSSWEQHVSDLERPLSERGHSDANLISQNFTNYNFMPDGIFSSPANRAITTCKIFMDQLKYPAKLLTVNAQLYDFGGDRVLSYIKSLNDDLNKIIVFGHNHAFTTLANRLGDRYINNLPTSGLVMIQFASENWSGIKNGITKMILTPKDYK